MNAYNIPDEIFEYVSKFQNGKNPIGFIDNINGLSYVHTVVDGCDVTLSAIKHFISPQKLSDPCNITIWFDDDWMQGLNIQCPDVKGAIHLMVNMNQGITRWNLIDDLTRNESVL